MATNAIVIQEDAATVYVNGEAGWKMANKTALDAYYRVASIRLGMIADASDEYLVALSNELAKAKDIVEQELKARISRAGDSEEFDTDLGLV